MSHNHTFDMRDHGATAELSAASALYTSSRCAPWASCCCRKALRHPAPPSPPAAPASTFPLLLAALVAAMAAAGSTACPAASDTAGAGRCVAAAAAGPGAGAPLCCCHAKLVGAGSWLSRFHLQPGARCSKHNGMCVRLAEQQACSGDIDKAAAGAQVWWVCLGDSGSSQVCILLPAPRGGGCGSQ